MTLKISTLISFLGSGLLFAAVVYSFQVFVSVTYAYLGFRPVAGSITYLMQASVFMALVLAISQFRSDSLKLLLMLQLFVPVMGVILLHANGIASTQTLMLGTGAIALVSLFALPLQRIRYSIRLIRSEKTFVWVGMALVTAYLLILIQQRGIGNIVLSFSEVYEYRSVSSGSYVVSLLRSIALTFSALLFAYALLTKRHWLTVFCVACYLLFFIYSGHKRFIFLIPFVFMVYFAISRNRMRYVIFIYIAPVLLGTALYLAFGSSQLLNFVARRSIMIPSLLTEFYVQYFSEYGAIWFAHSKLGVLLGSFDPNLPPPAQMVGTEFFSQGANANANWIGSSYMNMGNIGIFVYAPFVAFLFALPGMLTRTINRQMFLIASVVVYSSFMQNNDLVSALLSNGVAMFVFAWMLWGNIEITVKGKAASRVTPDITGLGLQPASVAG